MIDWKKIKEHSSWYNTSLSETENVCEYCEYVAKLAEYRGQRITGIYYLRFMVFVGGNN